jgi:hypothetical protein
VEYLTTRRRSSPAPPGALAAPRRALLAEQDARLLINDLDGDFAEQAVSETAGETTVFGGDPTP